jgi:hypothetical protein
MKKKITTIYITEETANAIKTFYVKETGLLPNLSGAITYLANKIEKDQKTH